MAFLSKSASTVRTLCLLKTVANAEVKCCQLGIQAPVTVSQSRMCSTLDGLKKKHLPTDFDKRMLVWSKIYKTTEEVPDSISFTKMSKAKDYFRVRFAAIMSVATFVASIGYIISGKRAVQRGESVSRMNLEWQQRNRDEVQARKRQEGQQ
ncbi:UPF0389 protein CG9231-like [Gigantopelta aegis]|uniref:UPF0389 protein CG9231-like n=1 Tax=Gigantopelta aegis TaxID=1735272 RepID=UPI001B888BE5|nr:UPF0389 protein CG9231-like [Gigantopelta aegis]